MTSKHHNHHLYMPRYTLKVVRFVGEGYLDKARFARTHFVMAPFGTFDKRETLKGAELQKLVLILLINWALKIISVFFSIFSLCSR